MSKARVKVYQPELVKAAHDLGLTPEELMGAAWCSRSGLSDDDAYQTVLAARRIQYALPSPSQRVYTARYADRPTFLREGSRMIGEGWRVQQQRIVTERPGGFVIGFGWLGAILMALFFWMRAKNAQRYFAVTWVWVGNDQAFVEFEDALSKPLQVSDEHHLITSATAEHLQTTHGISQDHIAKSPDLVFVHRNAHWVDRQEVPLA